MEAASLGDDPDRLVDPANGGIPLWAGNQRRNALLQEGAGRLRVGNPKRGDIDPLPILKPRDQPLQGAIVSANRRGVSKRPIGIEADADLGGLNRP
jgi:hypothetical protein